MLSTDLQVMPLNNFELRDNLLHLKSHITSPSFPHIMPRNTVVDDCDNFSNAPKKAQICVLMYHDFIRQIRTFEEVQMILNLDILYILLFLYK
jgi:hypothetical protein